MIRLIDKHGFNYVYISDPASDGVIPQDVIQESVRTIVSQKVAATFEGVKDNLAFETFAPEHIKQHIERNARYTQLINLKDIRETVLQIVNDIVTSQTKVFTGLPIKSVSGKEYQHAVDVTILSLLIGQHFRFDKHEMKVLGTAAILHDVGKIAFAEILSKPDAEKTAEERNLLYEHPVFSMLIVRGSEEEAFVEQTVVMQHHEQANGKGYPQHLKSKNQPPVKSAYKDATKYSHRYADILAVANTYDNLINGSWDGTRYSPVDALKLLMNGSTGTWNDHVINALARVVECYPVGAMVKITNTSSGQWVGYSGVVKMHNPNDTSKPVLVLTHNSMNQPIKARIVNLCEEHAVKLELWM